MGKNNIILVGFMASGKTTTGKLLSDVLNYSFIDTDRLIEEMEGKTINDIFNLKGEAYFRELESKILDLLSSSENTVISTGGGIVISEDNRKKLKDIGNVIYLNASPEWILANLNRSNIVRPLLLKEKEPGNKVKEILYNRLEFYEGVADYIIIVNDKSPMEIVDNIICTIQYCN